MPACPAVLCCLIMVSCAGKQEIKQADIEPYAGAVTIEVLKQSIGFGSVSSIKALADVKVFKDNEPEGSFTGVFGYKSPQNMRVSLFGPFGLTVMDFLISGSLLQMHIPPQNIIYEWESPYISFNSLLNDRFIYILEEGEGMYALSAYVPENPSDEPAARYLFDKTYLLNRSVFLYKDGMEIIKADFHDFNGRVAEKIVISFLNRSSMEISLQEAEYNTDVPEEYFRPVEHTDRKVLPFQDLLKRLEPKR